jgi:hypothetical protein
MEKSNGFHAMMYAIWELLDKVDIHQDKISMNAIKLGKLIKRQKLKSKHTLDQKEIRYYTISLVEIFKSWGTHGHKDWKVKEKDMASVFTVNFERKEFANKGGS